MLVLGTELAKTQQENATVSLPKLKDFILEALAQDVLMVTSEITANEGTSPSLRLFAPCPCQLQEISLLVSRFSGRIRFQVICSLVLEIQ